MAIAIVSQGSRSGVITIYSHLQKYWPFVNIDITDFLYLFGFVILK